MGISVGELFAYLDLKTKGFDQGVNQAEGKFKGLGSKLGAAGKAIGVGAGGALAAGLGMGMAAQMEIGAATAKLEAQLGGAGPISEKAGKVAGSLYADAYGASMGEVTDAVRLVTQNIAGMADASEADLQNITGQVMSLSEAFGQDLAGTTRAVDQMLRTGLAGSAQEALDILAAGFQQGADEAGDLLDTFSEYGTQFRKVGLDGQTAMGLISQGLKAGARDADIVADAVKEFSIRAVDGSKEAAASFEALGFNAEAMQATFAKGGPEAAAAFDQVVDKLRDTEGAANASEIAVGLFGTQFEDLGAALYALDPSSAVAGLGELEGASQRTNAALSDTAQNKITELQRKFTDLATQAIELPGPMGTAAAAIFGIGPSALSTLLPIAMMASSHKLAADAVSAAGGTMRKGMVKTVAATVLGWGKMAITSLLSAGKMALAWVIAMGPIGWIIAAVIGLVALIIANWDKVKAFTIKAWAAVSNAVSQAWDWIKSKVSTAVSSARDAVVNGFNNVVGFVRGIPGKIVSALGNLGRLLVGAGRSLVMGLWDGIQAAWGWLVGKFEGLLQSIRDRLPFSPAKEGPFSGRGYTTYSGRALMRDFAKGIAGEGPRVESALEDVLGAGARINPSMPRLGGRAGGGGGMAGIEAAVERGTMRALDGARMEIDGSGVARLVNRQNLTGRRRGTVAAI